jgi:dienelactone hydrolase
MHEKTIEIPTADGRMETFFTHPEEGGPFAPVVVYIDVWGLHPVSGRGSSPVRKNPIVVQ